MSLPSNSIRVRAPLWNKAMVRYLGAVRPDATKQSDAATTAGRRPTASHPVGPALALDEKILAGLGLKAPPDDPRLLAEHLRADDAADAANHVDEFARGIRRAVRMSLALSAGLHRQAGQSWKEWVGAQFHAGYACFHRYYVAAQLQIGLMARGLPALRNEHQSRAIAPFRQHEKFWTVLAGDPFKNGLPPAAELKRRLQSALGLESAAAAATTRIRLHRGLRRMLAAIPASEDDPAVAEARALLCRAIAILEQGRTAA